MFVSSLSCSHSENDDDVDEDENNIKKITCSRCSRAYTYLSLFIPSFPFVLNSWVNAGGEWMYTINNVVLSALAKIF